MGDRGTNAVDVLVTKGKNSQRQWMALKAQDWQAVNASCARAIVRGW